MNDVSTLLWIDLFRILWKRRLGLILWTIISAGFTVAIVLSLTPIYISKAVIEQTESSDQGGISSLGSLVGGLSLPSLEMGQDKRTARNEYFLKSRTLGYTFIKEKSLLPIIFAKRWDVGAQKWTEGEDVPTLWEAYKVFDEDIRETQYDNKTGLIKVSMKWSDPQLAFQWVEDYLQIADTILRETDKNSAEERIEYLLNHLSGERVIAVQNAISKNLEIQYLQLMNASVSKQYAFQTLDPPVVAEKRAWPKRTKMTLFITFGNIILGFMAVILFEIAVGYYRKSTGVQND